MPIEAVLTVWCSEHPCLLTTVFNVLIEWLQNKWWKMNIRSSVKTRHQREAYKTNGRPFVVIHACILVSLLIYSLPACADLPLSKSCDDRIDYSALLDKLRPDYIFLLARQASTVFLIHSSQRGATRMKKYELPLASWRSLSIMHLFVIVFFSPRFKLQ